MEFVKVKSSMIKEVAHSADTGTLYVRIKNDTLYSYSDVPVFMFKELLEAESKGKFFTEHIKKVFSFKRLLEEP